MNLYTNPFPVYDQQCTDGIDLKKKIVRNSLKKTNIKVFNQQCTCISKKIQSTMH